MKRQTVLKKGVVAKINTKEMKNKMALMLNISPVTLWRWIKANDPRLTSADMLEFLEKELDMKKELLTEVIEFPSKTNS